MARKIICTAIARGLDRLVAPPAKLPKHPVRLLRTTLGLSRKEFAKLIGTSVDTIVSIENDRLRLSARLARRINFITGANYRELLEGRNGRLRSNKGLPYTIAVFHRRNRQYANPPSDVVQLLSSELGRRSRAVLVNAGKRGFLAVAYCDILDSIEMYESEKTR